VSRELGAVLTAPSRFIWTSVKRLNNGPFSLDSKPCFDLLPDFDGKYSPVHDKWSAIFFIVDRFSFEFAARFQRNG
jgi:hypothetical protein